MTTMNIDPNRVIEKYRSQLMAANEKNAVLEAAVDQLTEKNEELMYLLTQSSEEATARMSSADKFADAAFKAIEKERDEKAACWLDLGAPECTNKHCVKHGGQEAE